MARMSPAVERQVRIEMLRAQAALEREALVRRVVETGHELAPANLLRSLLPARLAGLAGGHGRSTGGVSLLWQAWVLARRYPLVSSTLSSVLLGRGKRRRLVKLAAVGLVGWQLFKAWQDSSHQDGPPESSPGSSGSSSATPPTDP